MDTIFLAVLGMAAAWALFKISPAASSQGTPGTPGQPGRPAQPGTPGTTPRVILDSFEPSSSFTTGTEFLGAIRSLTGSQREAQILAAFTAGKISPVVQNYITVTTAANGHTGSFLVSADYVGIGTIEDWLRTPMYPSTAQRVADMHGALLPTKKMTDLIYAQAPIKIGFTAFDPAREGVARGSSTLYGRSNAAIVTRMSGRIGLASGQKKDIVIGSLLARSPGKVIIYGGHYTSGEQVQPYSNIHSASYVDYSHGVRLVKDIMTVDGRPARVADVLRDASLAPLISDEGVVPVSGLRYAF